MTVYAELRSEMNCTKCGSSTVLYATPDDEPPEQGYIELGIQRLVCRTLSSSEKATHAGLHEQSVCISVLESRPRLTGAGAASLAGLSVNDILLGVSRNFRVPKNVSPKGHRPGI